MEQTAVTLNGLRFRLYTWGKPTLPLLLFLHGWMDTGASFTWVAEHLKDRFHCIAPDLRGFGQSDHTPNPLGYFFVEYVADVIALINRLSPDHPIHLLGHSMGGNIAAMVAGAFPDRISHFINVEGFGIRDMPASEGPARIRQWIERIETHRFKPYPSWSTLAARLQEANPHLSEDQALFLARHMGKESDGGIILAADPKHKLPNPYLYQLSMMIPFWQAITAKCLLITAEHTQMASWMGNPESIHHEMERRCASFPTGSQQVEIPNCGHMIHQEKPHELATVIRHFI